VRSKRYPPPPIIPLLWYVMLCVNIPNILALANLLVVAQITPRGFLIFKTGCRVNFCYFSHTKVAIFVDFTCFYLIFSLLTKIFGVESLWTLQNTFLTIKSRKLTKKYFWPPFCMGSAHCVTQGPEPVVASRKPEAGMVNV
jgi:hypothetical protein